MNRHLFLLLAAFSLLSSGCKRGKNLTKGDIPAASNSVEALSDRFQKNVIPYAWLRIKTGLTYEDPDNSYSAAAQLKLHKDKLIWGSVTMLIELVRAQINQDSATMLMRTSKEYSSFPVSQLQQMLAIQGLDLSALQRLMLAQPPFGFHKASILTPGANMYLVEHTSTSFKEQMQVALNATHLLRYRYEKNYNEYMEVLYSDFTEMEGRTLPKKIEITVARLEKIKITLDISDYTFLDTDEAPFSIPSNYKRAQ